MVSELCGDSFFEEDCATIAIKTQEYLENRDLEKEKDVIELVRKEHTYVNRCQSILDMVKEIRK